MSKNNSLPCVGIDPDPVKFTEVVGSKPEHICEFCRTIIYATADLVCCYKFNGAFFEPFGPGGISHLQKLADYVQKNYPEIPTILDAKRGDIGNTDEQYTRYAFDSIATPKQNDAF